MCDALGGGVTFVFIMSKKGIGKISLKGKNYFFTSAAAQTKRVDSKVPKGGRLFGGRVMLTKWDEPGGLRFALPTGGRPVGRHG